FSYGVRFFSFCTKDLLHIAADMEEEHIRTIIKQNEQLHQVIGDMARTLKVICDVVCTNLSPAQSLSDPDPTQPIAYKDEELITVKEAEHIMNVCRAKIDKLRLEGKLTTVRRNNERPVRLIKKEVENARKWYS